VVGEKSVKIRVRKVSQLSEALLLFFFLHWEPQLNRRGPARPANSVIITETSAIASVRNGGPETVETSAMQGRVKRTILATLGGV
jgi:hypothetical protein